MAASPEQKKQYQVVKNFKGVNTKANRTAIDDTEFAWLENAMPIGYGNLKIVAKQSVLSANVGNTVVALFSCNINNKDFLLAFEQDGRCEYFDVSNFNAIVSGCLLYTSPSPRDRG